MTITMTTIRLANRKDVEIIKTYRDLASNESPYVGTMSATKLKAVFDTITNTNGDFYYIAMDEGKVIGQIIFFLDITNHKLYIKNLSVLKEFYGSGLSGKLLELAERTAINAKLMTSELIVDKNNKRGVGFYEKLGYRCITEFKKGSSNHVYNKTLSQNNNQTQ